MVVEGGNGPNLSMLTPIFQIASDIFAACTREVTLTVTFPPTGRLPDLKVTTHMVDDICLAREMAKVPGVPGLPGLPPGTLPPGMTNPLQPGQNPLMPGGGNPQLPGGGGKPAPSIGGG